MKGTPKKDSLKIVSCWDKCILLNGDCNEKLYYSFDKNWWNIKKNISKIPWTLETFPVAFHHLLFKTFDITTLNRKYQIKWPNYWTRRLFVQNFLINKQCNIGIYTFKWKQWKQAKRFEGIYKITWLLYYENDYNLFKVNLEINQIFFCNFEELFTRGICLTNPISQIIIQTQATPRENTRYKVNILML